MDKINNFFNCVAYIEDHLWSGVAIVGIVLSLYLSLIKRFQHLKFLSISHTRQMFGRPSKQAQLMQDTGDSPNNSVSPLKLLMISIGGMVGVGNMVSAVMSVVIGGPGALLWLWIGGATTVIFKYCEIYLGVLYRRKKNNQYIGGPMYFLEAAFTCSPTRSSLVKKLSWLCVKVLPKIVAMMLIIYGVEIYIFLIINDQIASTLDMPKSITTALLVGITIYAAIGGVRRVANICMAVVPVMVISYILICMYIISQHSNELLGMLSMVVNDAFTGSAAMGGFVGSTIMMAIKQGISRVVYSTDMALGFDSSIHCQTSYKDPYYQARLAIWATAIDMIFCTMSILVVLITGVWSQDMIDSQYISQALSMSLPGIDYFMMFFIFTTGWTTILGYLLVGKNSCNYLFKSSWASNTFYLYAIVVFSFFSFAQQSQVYSIMSTCGAILFFINAVAIVILRDQIKFAPNQPGAGSKDRGQ